MMKSYHLHKQSQHSEILPSSQNEEHLQHSENTENLNQSLKVKKK